MSGPPLTTTASTDPTIEPREWAQFPIDTPGCVCSDGTPYSVFERPGDPEKLLLYFKGGGACFNEDGCRELRKGVGRMLGRLNSNSEQFGIFDLANPENPVADYTMVLAPYCTGDLHLGNTRTVYSDAVVVEHRGAVNARAALDHLVDRYPDATDVIVAGASAGAPIAPLMGAMVTDRLPAARVVTFGDSAGAYPDTPDVNTFLNDVWGTHDAMPDWPVNDGITPAAWGLERLVVQAGLHAPGVTFARFDHAFDDSQGRYAALAGVDPDALVDQIDAVEAQIEAAGVPLSSYVAPGAWHVVLDGERLYEVEVEGVRLVDWLTELVEDTVPDDVHCVECRVE